MKKDHCFHTSAHAKCILAGEHTVLKGHPALVLPVHAKSLSLTCTNSKKAAHIDYHHSQLPFEETFLIFFWDTVKAGCSFLKKDMQNCIGQISLENNIPMGAGIGFSSALCVVLARWFAWEHLIKPDQIFYFAKKLEDIFHGKSSGVDIAGAMSDEIIHFELNGYMHPIKPKWQPKLYLSYSGQPKQTAHAVSRVMAFRKAHVRAAKILDNEMQESVMQIENALQLDEANGFSLFVEAILHAYHCFLEWDLITLTLQQHIDELYRYGAVAVKPTGSGEGGYVLSLWNKAPPESLSSQLIPIFDHHSREVHHEHT